MATTPFSAPSSGEVPRIELSTTSAPDGAQAPRHGALGPRDKPEGGGEIGTALTYKSTHAASNDNDPSPAAPAMPIPLAAEFGFVRAFAQAERQGAIAHGSLIIERRS